MTTHNIGTREQWLAARLELLDAEKALTRQSDELAQRRQELPWVRVDKDYRFDTDEGTASLADLFRGRSQLLVYHFMFGPDYKAGCASCSSIADGFDGIAVHLANHDVMLWAASRAPLAKLQAFKQRMGWTFPWASSQGGDFNYDFNVSITEEQQREGGTEYNYRRGGHAMTGDGASASRHRQRGEDRSRACRLCARAAGSFRLRARGRRRLSHLFDLCPRAGRAVGHVPVARPRPQRAQRGGRVVASPRQLPAGGAMIATRDEAGRPGDRALSHAAALGGWLGLAAAPTFAAMAAADLVAGGDADVMCSAVHGSSPLGGMVPMYVLMSAFHAGPWLRLMSRR